MMTLRRYLLLGAAATACAAPWARPASAQGASNWPNRPIRLILGFAPGGVGDFTARLVAPKLGEALGQAIVIDNRPSAGGIVAAEAVIHSPADGYTLLLLTNTNVSAASLYRVKPYDVMQDFVPIGRLATFDHVFLTGAKSPYKTLQDVFAAARAKPGSINLGSISVGNAQNLGAELLKSMAGVDMTIVPYRSTPELVNATITGDVHIASEILAPVLSQIQGGAVRPLAVGSAERFPLLPDVPTVKESGLPDYVVGSWNGLAAPAGTPKEVVERVSVEIRRVMAMPDIQKRLIDIGVAPAASNPSEFGTFIREESERWGLIIESAKIPKQ